MRGEFELYYDIEARIRPTPSQRDREARGGRLGEPVQTITDAEIRTLAESAKPYSLAILRWGPDRHQDGAGGIELEHQRRLVGLRAEGIIAVLCPVASDSVCGVLIMTVPPTEAMSLMTDDPCVRAGMMTCEVHLCHSFPGDSLPA